ncbi:MAG: enoyl-CoA hydratase/isomerase family protein [Planctomycetes bacterium]|nr:enoyl-CoA hydratase/isomerase family protein [Planctomycetota bacterium]
MIHREQHASVTVLRLEHGKVQALDVELCNEIGAAFEGVDDWRETRAVVLTGTGSSFSAGVDLYRVLEGGAAYVDQFLPALDRACAAIFRCPKPVVGALNGHAIAGGMILACACDVRVMANGKGRMGVTELSVGVPFPWLALEILRLSTPVEHLQELLYLGQTYTPAESLARGLVDEVVEADKLAARALELADRLARIPQPAFALPKRQLRQHSLEQWKLQSAHEHMVRLAWHDPETLAAIKRFLDATLKK